MSSLKQILLLSSLLLFPIGSNADNTTNEQKAGSHQTPVYSIDEDNFQIKIGRVDLFVDPRQELKIEKILQMDEDKEIHWENRSNLNFGYSPIKVWIKFEVRNPLSVDQRLIFEQRYPLIQDIAFWSLNKNRLDTSYLTGRNFEFSGRPIEHRNFLFPLLLKAGDSETIIMSLASKGTLRADLNIYTYSRFITVTTKTTLWLGIYFGIILAMAGYNLFLLFGTGDLSYLYYVCYVLSFGLLQLSLSGQAYQFLWPTSPEFNRITVPLFVGLTVFFLSIFSVRFLEAGRRSHLANGLLFGLAGISFLYTCASLLISGIMVNELASVLMIAAPALIAVASIVCMLKGSKSATLFLTAFCVFLISSLLSASRDLGLIPANSVTVYLWQIGSTLEMILLSLALAGKIRTLQHEKTESTLEASRVQVELEKRTRLLEKERSLAEAGSQLAHDISSPLSTIEAALVQMGTVPETIRILVRSAINSIKDITNQLNDKKRSLAESDAIPSPSDQSTEPQLISALVELIVSQKRLEYRVNPKLTIQAILGKESYGLFAAVQATEFKRLLSNLINNSVQHMSRDGSVEISFLPNPKNVCIQIKDTGDGIPKGILNSLNAGTFQPKKNGGGLGSRHALSKVKEWNGKIRFDSAGDEQGTTVTIQIPKVDPPSWFPSEIQITSGTTLIVLDDDPSIHQIWSERFLDQNRATLCRQEHFTTQVACAEFLEKKPSNLVALVDYELSEPTSGLDFIIAQGLQTESILVTSRWDEPRIIKQCSTEGIRILPKNMSGLIPIRVLKEPTLKRLDYVLIDDSSITRKTWEVLGELDGKSVRTFASFSDFKREIAEIPKLTPIYVDYHLRNDPINGLTVARQLTQTHFKNVCIYSGEDPNLLGVELSEYPFLLGKALPWRVNCS